MVQKLQFFPQTRLLSFLISYFPIANCQSPIAYRLSPLVISLSTILFSNCISHLLLLICQSSSPSAISHQSSAISHRHRPLICIFQKRQNWVCQYLHSWSSISRSYDRISLKIGANVACTPHHIPQSVASLESLRFKSYSTFRKLDWIFN